MTLREATIFNHLKHLRNLHLCIVLLVTLFTWSTNSQDKEVRLMDGGRSGRGIVEVLTIYGKWGTICSDNWDMKDATVVCRQLGYVGAQDYDAYALSAANLPVLVDDLYCTGTEYRIQDCFATWGVIELSKICFDEEVAVVDCLEESDIPDIQLADGAYPNQGRVEIHIGKWGTICDDMWSADEARIVCRQLGYKGEAQAIVPQGTFPPGSGKIFLDDVQCTGLEASIYLCSHQGRHDCVHSEDVGVVCLSDEYPNYAVAVKYSVTPSPETTGGGLSGAMKIVIGVSVAALVFSVSFCLLCRYKKQKEESNIQTNNESLAQRSHSYAIVAPTASLSGAESSEGTDVFQQVQSDHPHAPVAPTAPPPLPFTLDDYSTPTPVAFPSAAYPSPAEPSGSDLPPQYAAFIQNPDRFPVPLGQSPTDETTDVPVTPPPEYMPPPAMVFDSDANNEELRNTSSTVETVV